MKIVVIGSETHLGRYTVDELTAQKHEVVSIPVLAFADFKYAFNHLTTANAIAYLDATGIAETIAEPWDSTEKNLMGFLALITAAKEWKIPIVYSSDASVYGVPSGETPITEFSSFSSPLTSFAADMLARDMYAQLYFKLHGLKTIGLRLFSVYGAEMPNSVITKFIDRGLKYEPILLLGDGMQKRNFIYFCDVIKIICSALTGTFNGSRCNFAGFHGLLNIGNPTGSIEIGEMIRVMNRLMPEPLTVTRKDTTSRDARALIPDLSALSQLLPNFEYTSLEDGIRKTIQQLEVR